MSRFLLFWSEALKVALWRFDEEHRKLEAWTLLLAPVALFAAPWLAPKVVTSIAPWFDLAMIRFSGRFR